MVQARRSFYMHMCREACSGRPLAEYAQRALAIQRISAQGGGEAALENALKTIYAKSGGAAGKKAAGPLSEKSEALEQAAVHACVEALNTKRCSR